MNHRIALAFLILTLSVSVCGQPRSNTGGVWEGVIEVPRRPIVLNVDFDTSTASLSGGSPLQLTPVPVASNDNRVVGFVINTLSLRFTGTRYGNRITGSLESNNQKAPFWLELLPTLPPPANRVEAWQQDLDQVISRFLRYDRSYSPARREATRVALQNLRARVHRLNDDAIRDALARAVAISGNAHTRLYLIRNRTEVRRVPLRVWWFANQLRVIRASNENANLLGCEVTRIGRLSPTVAFQKVRGIKAGNLSWQRYMSAYLLTSPDILHGAGVLPDAERLPLTFRCGARTVRATLTPLPLKRTTAAVEAWWDLSPSYPHADGMKHVLTGENLPLYLRKPAQNYSVEYLPEESLIYVQYNRSQPMSATPMSDFTAQVLRLLDEHQVKGFVVDVRFNTGGDAGTGTPFVQTVAPRLKGIPVVVITSRVTFSAGITHAAQWKQFANALVVGEPVGDDLDSWSEGGNILLPNSKLTVHYANGFHSYSRKDYPENQPYFYDLNIDSLRPDHFSQVSWPEYLQGKDPVLSAAIKRLATMRPKR
jgi:hypothetical protein